MKTASAELIQFLNTSQTFYVADCYSFNLADGSTVRYTNADVDIVLGTFTYSSLGPQISRSRIRTVIGIEVDTLQVTINASVSHLLNGKPWFAAMRQGALDGARVYLQRVFMPSWGDTSLGSIMLFGGRVAEIEIGKSSGQITIKSDLDLLNVKMPKNLFQPSCLNTLFDSNCTKSKVASGVTGTISSSTVSDIYSNHSHAAGRYDMGTLTITSGVNNGITRSVRSYTQGHFEIAVPLLVPCNAGDSMVAYPGCDRTIDTCTGKFFNASNFRGFPFVPIAESVL